jgi:hypothetical protein
MQLLFAHQLGKFRRGAHRGEGLIGVELTAVLKTLVERPAKKVESSRDLAGLGQGERGISPAVPKQVCRASYN